MDISSCQHILKVVQYSMVLMPQILINSLLNSSIRVLSIYWRYFTKKKSICKKRSYDPDNHNAVITHLKPDIQECKVKWALGCITMNKANGGGGIPAELFQILKMTLWKCCTQYASKFGKHSSGHRTRKGQFSFQSQRKAMPKNVRTPHNCTHLTC